jgi:hypothetical protein
MADEGLWELAKAVWFSGALSGFVQMFLAALLAAVLTHLLTHRRFIQGRWWDRKADAYSKIISTLVDMEYFLESWIDFGEQLKSLVDGDEGQEPEWKRLDELRAEHDKSMERIRRPVIEGDYIISRKAARVLSKFLEGYPEYFNNAGHKTYDEIMDFLRSRSRAVRSCLESVRAEAQSDLRVKGCSNW